MRRQIILATVAALVSGPALAQQAKPAASEDGVLREKLAMCIGCHGIVGYKTAFPSVYHVPMIAGQQAGYIVSALQAYKSGQRSHPSMRAIAASLSDDDMKAIAAHYAEPAK